MKQKTRILLSRIFRPLGNFVFRGGALALVVTIYVVLGWLVFVQEDIPVRPCPFSRLILCLSGCVPVAFKALDWFKNELSGKQCLVQTEKTHALMVTGVLAIPFVWPFVKLLSEAQTLDDLFYRTVAYLFATASVIVTAGIWGLAIGNIFYAAFLNYIRIQE